MSRADRLALLLSLLGILAALLVTQFIFEGLPHIEDELAYAWQAKVIARGQLTIPSPSHPSSYLVPFVVDYHGQRFGKYPLGWPVLLAVAVRLGLRSWLNPLLAGLGVWLTYRLGKRLFTERIGLLAAALTVISPFFLMNSGSLLSHSFGLVLSAAFTLAWLDAFCDPTASRKWLPTMVAGLTLGILALTRPLTAVGVALPFGLHGLHLLLRGNPPTRRRLLALGGLVVLLVSLYPLWQYAVTGDPFLNPYTLWWKYDTIGFGPEHGWMKGGHTLLHALNNASQSLWAGCGDLFGWWRLSWIFLPFGMWATRHNRRGWLVGGVFLSLVILYLAYWIGAELFGPRYYYEALFSLTLFSAAGVALLLGWPLTTGEAPHIFNGRMRYLPRITVLLLVGLVAYNLIFYLPHRLGDMQGLYGLERADLRPFLTPQADKRTPALVIVHAEDWMEYGALLELEDPWLTTPFVFAWSIGPKTDETLAGDFPDRAVYHYYPDEPGQFYSSPRP